MSYSYDNSDVQVIGTFYLIFGIGCIIFFLGGVCALLCCCKQKFRGLERKGYVIRDVEQNAPLIVPSVQGPGSVVPMQPAPYPAGPPTAPGWVGGYPPADPPPYGSSPPQPKY